MKMTMKPTITSILCVILLLSSLPLLHGEEAAFQPLDQWLVLGPAQIPALEKKILDGNKNILDFKHLDPATIAPVEDQKVRWSSAQTLDWRKMQLNVFKAYDTGALYLATYIDPSRWMKTTLNIHNTNLGCTVVLDGKIQKAQLLKDKISCPLKLTNEKHLLVLKLLLIKGETFTFKASLTHDKDFEAEKPTLSLSPKQRLQPDQVLTVNQVTSVKVSPDGKQVAVSLSRTDKYTGKADSWLEILNTSDGAVIYSSLSSGKLSGFQWMGSSAFSHTQAEKSLTTIYKYDLQTHTQTPIIENIKNLNDYTWAPDLSYIVYSKYHREESGDLYKYIKEISDRALDSGYTYSMYLYYPMGGITHQVSDEDNNFSEAIISPDSKSIIFRNTTPDNSNRPYTMEHYFLFNTTAMEIKPLLEAPFITSAQWSPDSKTILFLGGASSFDNIGKTIDITRIPNDFDTQAYLFHRATKKAEAISRNLDPTINSASWSSSAGNIYFNVTDKTDNTIYRYSINKKTYKRLDTGMDVISRIDYARNRNTAVYWGSSANVPHKLYKINLSAGKGVLLKDYNKNYFQNVVIGTVKNWDYKTPSGQTIKGRLHYPPDFDATKKYPCIVYFYGGTSTVTRDFGGRYPKNWYAASGYIVYVLQPSGTTGFGQEFAAAHVNDWGKTTAVEVVDAVKELLKEHPYIDAKAVGAMGASYGGFLTQYIATQTDIFAAFISHAGISALSSYWGVGDWGYTYSGVATADSFPWNRKDIYVGNSPLFMADRITSPLLLLHGDADNNVPPGESYQMFAALKLLKKEVALVTFKDQKHWILSYKKRLHWMRTIIAWWDKYLKKQPQQWEDMY